MNDTKNIKSHKIHLFKEHKEINCLENSTILEATLAAHINHTHACGGQAKCSTCRVSIRKGLENCSPRNEAEKLIADIRQAINRELVLGSASFKEKMEFVLQVRVRSGTNGRPRRKRK